MSLIHFSPRFYLLSLCRHTIFAATLLCSLFSPVTSFADNHQPSAAQKASEPTSANGQPEDALKERLPFEEISSEATSSEEKEAIFQAELWDQAQLALREGDIAISASFFYEIHRRYPERKDSDVALWMSANLSSEVAKKSVDGDWEAVRDKFRRFISRYPRSTNVPEAYFALGRAHFYMHFYREALAYFKLFTKRYPDSPLLYPAKEWEALALLRVGKSKEAEQLMDELVPRVLKEKDTKLKIKGLISVGNVRFAQSKFREARNFYQMVILADPNYHMTDPEILKKAGLANVQYGKIIKGRGQLYHYLNLSGDPNSLTEVLYGIAESYRLAGDNVSAKKMYDKIIDDGEPTNVGVMLSKVRIARYLDDPEMKLSKWNKKNDLTDPEGDEPYLAVLEKLPDNPVAQIARYGLFLRHKARKDLEKSYELGRAYLTHASSEETDPQERQRIAGIFLHLGEELLKDHKFQEIYDLYFVEYQHLKHLVSGRILYLVGQAMEELNLFDQAAIVYFRAMKGPITEEEKIDLYYRRANVYLTLKDYESADRLLVHLRKIYKNTPVVAKAYYYSGQLAEAQMDFSEALGHYIDAMVTSTASEDINVDYANKVFRLALELGRNDQAVEFFKAWGPRFAGKPAQIQEWSLQIGNSLRLSGEYTEAIAVYSEGLAEGMPQGNQSFQSIQLYLGDSYYTVGDKTRGLEHYKNALSGNSDFIKQLATERLNQDGIDNDVAEMKKGI